jgi:hypothetical protein
MGVRKIILLFNKKCMKDIQDRRVELNKLDISYIINYFVQIFYLILRISNADLF